ncbi:MAG: translation initiation factor IF-1 [Candidatus Pacebacteria bacterium]|jgi:translation initiation factor IF-1|nr:translation initiation factor IF-1 [Candidatus Paceibacterota bacterium]
MPNKNEQRATGVVTEALPNTMFRVQTSNGILIAYLAGKMRMNRIKVLIGDKVELVLDEYGGKARVVKRL